MTTYQHTLPCGTELTFEVESRPARHDDLVELCVSYPADGTDLSGYSTRDAYPIFAIEADYGSFRRCLSWGEEQGTVYEIWQMAR